MHDSYLHTFLMRALRRRTARWQAVVVHRGGVRKVVGSFDTEIAAASAYDEVAEDELGIAANLNFPDTGAFPYNP